MGAVRGYSVFMRKGRPVWYITYLSADTGGWKQQATEFRLDDRLGEKKATRLAEQRTEQFYRSVNTGHREAWVAWVRPFLKARYRGLTLQRYELAWDNLATFLQQRKIIGPATLNYNHLLAYLEWRTAQKRNNGKHITRNSAIFELKLMGVVMREAMRRGFTLVNPCDRMGIAKDPAKEKRELTDDDLAKLRAYVAREEGALPIAQRWMTVSLEIAIHQGCRLRETSLPMSDVDLQRNTITFRGKGRNNEPRIFTTALHPGLLPLMTELRAAGATMTCTLPKMAAKDWFFAFRKAGVLNASFHCTRVTVITRLARGDVPENKARRFVNHSSKAVHGIYQKLGAEDLGQVTAALKFPAPATEQNSGARPANS